MPALLPFQTLRGKLIFFACFATLPAFIFVVYIATNERATALQRTQTESLYVAESASREHAYQVQGAKRLLERLSARQFDGSAAASLPVLLPAILSGFPQLANIGTLTSGGEVAFSAIPPPRHINMAQVPAFQAALASNEVVIGTYLVGLIVERPILIMAKSVRGIDGQLQSVLFAALELEWLDQLAKKTGLPTDSDLLIVDREGSILASSLSDKHGPSDRRVLKGMKQLLQSPGSLTRCQTPDGIMRLAVAHPLEGLQGLWVVVGAPEETVYGVANAIFFRDLVVLALLTLLAIISSLIATDLSVLKDIRALASATRRFGSGELQVRAPVPRPHGEIRNLAMAFNTMADTLTEQNHQAVLAQERLRALSHQLQNAREEEAARIAQELHDELGQELSVMRLELERLTRRILAHADTLRPEDLVAPINEFGERIDAAVRLVRRISSELRPGVLDRLGLQAGIEWLLNQFERRTGITTTLSVEGVRYWEDADLSTALFRITQEALTNIARHTQATLITTRLLFSDQQVALIIKDDGEGFNPGDGLTTPSLGLLGMQERAARLNGRLDINSSPGCGTELRATIPRPAQSGHPASTSGESA
jgi:signal transduction histidine kinase